IENQTSINYIVEYSCYIDQTGLGNFTLASTMPNTILDWWDQSYAFNPNTKYVIEAELPNCNITKANINTSRSNIKTQIANNEVGIESKTINTLKISPNPVEELLMIEDVLDFELIEIIDNTGSVVYRANPSELNNTVNVSFLKSGMYLLQARSSKGSIYTNKLIKL
ncbi:MAG: T9SS type A sorting domain-containing protein, partial [Crocinitomicaceae bacterium]